MTDWKQLLNDLGVPNWDAGKNVAPGNVNIRCPFCDDHSNHGGFSIDRGAYSCWRCKGGAPSIALARAANIPVETASSYIARYTTGKAPETSRNTAKKASATSLKLPGGTHCYPCHRRYLESRNFDPCELEFRHGIRYTLIERWGKKDIDVGYRIVIPVYDLEGRAVAWQARAINDEVQQPRYLFPDVEECLMHYKHTLYGAETCTARDSIVVCEGIFDQWRLGPGAVATFGTSLTREQVNLLSRWRRVFFLFDPEDTAQAHGRDYARDLAAAGCRVEVCRTDNRDAAGNLKDPGDMTPQEAREIMQELLGPTIM